MGVVEEEGELAALGPCAADRGHEGGLVPFVDEDEVGAVQGLVEVGLISVEGAGQARIGRLPAAKALLPLVADEVDKAPTGRGLVSVDLVAQGRQLTGNAAQEVGVAVIPAGGKRVAEKVDPHAAGLLAGAAHSSA
jgi:hypothetical protein